MYLVVQMRGRKLFPQKGSFLSLLQLSMEGDSVPAVTDLPEKWPCIPHPCLYVFNHYSPPTAVSNVELTGWIMRLKRRRVK